jgi:hypothetical protein
VGFIQIYTAIMSKRQCIDDGQGMELDTTAAHHQHTRQVQPVDSSSQQQHRDQDRQRRKQQAGSGLFELVLLGRMSLKDAVDRGLQLTAEQQKLYNQVKGAANMQLW